MALEHYQTAFQPLLYGVALADRAHVLPAGNGPGGATVRAARGHGDAMINRPTGTGKYEQLLARCRSLEPIATAVVHPCEATALAGAIDAAAQGLIVADPRRPVGEDPRGRGRARDRPRRRRGSSTRRTATRSAAAAVALVRQGQAELLMKGSLHTDELLGAVVARETGLRTGRRLSHAFIMDVPTYHKVLIVTDAAINIAPTLEDKADICPERDRPRRHRWASRGRRWRFSPRSRRSTRRCRRRSTPRRCARWPSAARSPAACSTARSPSTTRSARTRRRPRGSSRRWRAIPTSCWRPISKRATSWPSS